MKKYIVITGASSGIGAAAAKAFARRGENLILVARRGELLENLKSEIAKFANVDVVIELCDLSKQENTLLLWQKLEKFELKALINNAGFGDYNKVGEQNLDKITQMINLNIISLVMLSTLFTKKYKDKDTQLINISSIGGYKIVPNAVTYCASKFFVSAFSGGLYHELAQDKQAKLQAKVLAQLLQKQNLVWWQLVKRATTTTRRLKSTTRVSRWQSFCFAFMIAITALARWIEIALSFHYTSPNLTMRSSISQKITRR